MVVTAQRLISLLIKKKKPHQPGHDCCKNCAQTCNCLDTGCNVIAPVFERVPQDTAEQPCMTRPISFQDREDLRDALNELMEMIVPTVNLFSKIISHRYANDIVEGLEKKAHSIYSLRCYRGYPLVFCSTYSENP